MLKNAEIIMKNAKKRTEKDTVIFSEKIIRGIPGMEIVDFANSRKNSIDLVIIGGKSKGRPAESYFGSVSNYVLNKSKIPVLVV